MKIAILGPPTRISGSTKIAFGQAAALLKRGHDVRMFLQTRGLSEVRSAYEGIFPDSRIIELNPTPLLTPLTDTLTRSLRTLYYGSNAPLLGEVWYERKESTTLSNRVPDGRKAEGYVDFGSMLARSFSTSSSLSRWGCDAIVSNASLIAISAFPAFIKSRSRKAFYLFDMPASKTLAVEGKSSLIVHFVAQVERALINDADVLSCINRLTNRDWLSWMGVSPTLVLPGCNPSSHFSEDRSNFVLTVTHWYPSKHPEYFLGLARLIKSSSLHIVMAGHWPIEADLIEMKKEITRLGLEEQLRLYPEPTEVELTQLYSEARCFVAPPLAGGFIIGALEAAANGTPVMYPKSAGAWDALSPGVHGFVMEVENPAAVAQTILRFEDIGLVKEMGRRAWERAKELTWDNHAKEFEQLLFGSTR